jgi:hypothetical protein
MDKGWSVTGAAMRRGILERVQADFGVGAIDFGEVKIGEVRD